MIIYLVHKIRILKIRLFCNLFTLNFKLVKQMFFKILIHLLKHKNNFTRHIFNVINFNEQIIE